MRGAHTFSDPYELDFFRRRARNQRWFEGLIGILCVATSDLWPVHWLLS